MPGTYTKLYYHIVFSTKHRKPLITDAIELELHKYIGGIIRNIEGTCIEVNGMADHIHILAIIPPKISISDVLRSIKASSSKWIHDSHPTLSTFAWQDGYAAFTVSTSQVESVRNYIRNQKSHHHSSDYKTELISLLDKHGIEYDERYVWDKCRRYAAYRHARHAFRGLTPTAKIFSRSAAKTSPRK
jgi:putative transposase